jgi:hypothetical protein
LRAALLFILAATIFTACLHHSVPFHTGYPHLVAATDDTSLNYATTILPNGRFLYMITHRSQQNAIQRDHYNGTWEYRSDTVFLHYHKRKPPGLTDYLVKEITGGWLIQFFTDGRSRVFLRIWRRPLR